MMLVRRGYGASQGPDSEYLETAEESGFAGAKDVIAGVEYMRGQPDVDASKMLLMGHSQGGCVTLAASALAADGVLGAVNLSGGINFQQEHGMLAVLDHAGLADVEADAGVELERVATRGGLGIAVDHADLLAKLIVTPTWTSGSPGYLCHGGLTKSLQLSLAVNPRYSDTKKRHQRLENGCRVAVVPCLAGVRSQRSRLTSLVPALALLALTSACEGDRDLPNDQTWESAHFRYHIRKGDQAACEGVLLQLERNFEIMQGFLGLAWPAGKKVDYYKFRDQNDFRKNAPCSKNSASCTEDSSVMSPYVLQEHELIHAYLAPFGDPPSFFVEGAAVALSCDRPWDERSGTAGWQDVVTLTSLDINDVYKTGGWLVGYLLDRYRPAPFLVFYDRLKESASAENIALTFQEIYGESLDAVWDAATAAGKRVGCVNLWACQGPPLVLDGSPQTLTQACDGSDNSRIFALAADTDLMMSYSGTPYYTPVRCDSATFVGVSGYYTGIAQPAVLAHVTAGQYFVRAVGLATSGTAPIRALSAGAFVRDCGQAQPVDLGTSEFTKKRDLDLTIPNDGQPWFVKLHVPDDWHLWSTATASEHVMACPDCGDLSQCESFRGDAPLDGDGNVILRLTSTTPDPGHMSDSGYTTYSFGCMRRIPADAGVATEALDPDAE